MAALLVAVSLASLFVSTVLLLLAYELLRAAQRQRRRTFKEEGAVDRRSPGPGTAAPGPPSSFDVRRASWTFWYGFAKGTLGYVHREAIAYANRRCVEDENRERLEGRP